MQNLDFVSDDSFVAKTTVFSLRWHLASLRTGITRRALSWLIGACDSLGHLEARQ
jgi:hypothetical protein